MNITVSEWNKLLVGLRERAAARWPDMEVEQDESQISVSGRDAISGSLRLRVSTGRDLCMVPEVSVGSSPAYPGPLTLSMAQHQENGRVLEALHFLARSVDGYDIYLDGECPCDRCNGGGKAFRSREPCGACGGEGKR